MAPRVSVVGDCDPDACRTATAAGASGRALEAAKPRQATDATRHDGTDASPTLGVYASQIRPGPFRMTDQRPGLRDEIHALMEHDNGPREVHYRNGRFDGADLSGLRLDVPLVLEDTTFHGDVQLKDAHLAALCLRRCTLSGGRLDLDGVRVDADLVFTELVAERGVSARHARIDGNLKLTGGRLGRDDRTGADSSARDQGVLNLDGVDLKGDVRLSGVHLEGPIRAELAEINGSLMIEPANDTGTRSVVGAGPGMAALHLDAARIRGYVELRGAEIRGSINAINAHIGAQLQLTAVETAGGELLPTEVKDTATALQLDAATIEHSVILVGATIRGCINARGSRIGGQFTLRSWSSGASSADERSPEPCKILEPSSPPSPGNGVAVNLQAAKIGDSVFFDHCQIQGRIEARSARVGASFIVGNPEARIGYWSTPPNFSETEDALIRLDGAEVSGDFDLRRLVGWPKSTESKDQPLPGSNRITVRADRASIAGSVRLEGTTLVGDTAPRVRGRRSSTSEVGESPRMPALSLDHATLGQLWFDDDTELNGELRLRSAQIGEWHLRGGTEGDHPTTPGSLRRDRSRRHVVEYFMGSRWRPAGTAGNARGNSQAGASQALGRSLRDCALLAEGIRVGDLHGPIRNDLSIAKEWLSTRPADCGFAPQPWWAVAEVYERNGRPEFGRRLRAYAAMQTADHARGLAKVGQSAYGLLVGFGYYPLLAAVWLVLAVAAATGLFHAARSEFQPTDLPAAVMTAAEVSGGDTALRDPNGATKPDKLGVYPEFEALTYAVQTVVPTASAISDPSWQPSQGTWWLVLIVTVFKVVGIVLVALLLAGITGILRQT